MNMFQVLFHIYILDQFNICARPNIQKPDSLENKSEINHKLEHN